MTSGPAEQLAGALRRQGTTVAFGVPGGGPNLDVVGALDAQGIDFVLAHTETAACIMAATWGWLTDGVTATVVTRGPGAASAVNGAAQATLDRQPLLLVTDTVPSTSRDRVPHQRIDQQAMFDPVTKATAVLGSQSTTADVDAAVETAMAWPPGCVHLDYDASDAGTVVGPARQHQPAGIETIDRARELILGANHPVVILGVAAVRDAAQVRQAAEAFGAPVLSTYQGIGIVSTEHDQFAGLFTNGASEGPLLDQADLIIMVGVDMVEPIPAPWTYTAPVVSVAPSPIDSTYLQPAIELVGHVGSLTADVLAGDHDWSQTAGVDHNRTVRNALAEGAPSDVFGPVSLTTSLADLVPWSATVTVDAGAHFLAIMPFWPVERDRQLLISNGLATMGYAVPAAIGAALARPGEPVIALTGDGGLGMCLAELETIARRQLPITVVVFNDATLSLIKIKQHDHHGDERAVQYAPTDFAAVATGMGMAAAVVGDTNELGAALAHHDFASPLLIDARIDPASYPHLISVTRG